MVHLDEDRFIERRVIGLHVKRQLFPKTERVLSNHVYLLIITTVSVFLAHAIVMSLVITYRNPERPCSLDELLEQADKLMYERKREIKSTLSNNGSCIVRAVG